MRLTFILLLTIVCNLYTYSQIAHDLVLYSEDGLKFKLTVSGKLINEEFATSVDMKNIVQEYIKAYIEFEDTNIEPIKAMINLATPGTTEKSPQSCVYVIKNKKGVYKIRFESRSEKMIQSPDINIIINN